MAKVVIYICDVGRIFRDILWVFEVILLHILVGRNGLLESEYAA